MTDIVQQQAQQFAANPPAESSEGHLPVFRNLMAVGMLGSCYQAHEDADKVHDAVEATLTDVAPFRMYRALAAGIGGDSRYAAEHIGKRIEEVPDDDKAKVALAVTMLMSGNSEWRGLIENVLATSSDQVARESANKLISYLTSLKFH